MFCAFSVCTRGSHQERVIKTEETQLRVGFRTRQQVVGSELGKTDPWKLWEQAPEQEGDPLWPPDPSGYSHTSQSTAGQAHAGLMVAGAPEAFKDH